MVRIVFKIGCEKIRFPNPCHTECTLIKRINDLSRMFKGLPKAPQPYPEINRSTGYHFLSPSTYEMMTEFIILIWISNQIPDDLSRCLNHSIGRGNHFGLREVR